MRSISSLWRPFHGEGASVSPVIRGGIARNSMKITTPSRIVPNIPLLLSKSRLQSFATGRKKGEKKTDVGELPWVFPHVGLLIIEPPRPRSFSDQPGRVALYLVIRRLQFLAKLAERTRSLRLTTQHDHIHRNQESKELFGFVPQLVSFTAYGCDRLRQMTDTTAATPIHRGRGRRIEGRRGSGVMSREQQN
jgi:hypothetical protein